MKKFQTTSISLCALSLVALPCTATDSAEIAECIVLSTQNDTIATTDTTIVETYLPLTIAEDSAMAEPSGTYSAMTKKSAKDKKDKSYKNTVYWKRHNTFKALGWSFFGVGLPATAAGFFVGVFSGIGDSSNSEDGVAIGSILFYSGAALTLSSIPMFVLSLTNKHKAKQVSVGFTPMQACNGTAAPGLSFAMNF